MKVVLSEEEVKRAAIESLRKRFHYSVEVKFREFEYYDKSSCGMIFEVTEGPECEASVELEVLRRRVAP